MSRLTVAATVCVLALSLGCWGGGVTPRKPKDFVYAHLAEVPGAFSDMDLPWYGGQVERSTPSSMSVSYIAVDGANKEWLTAQWMSAFANEGWTETTRTESGNGDTSVIFTLPDGSTASASVVTHAHNVWWVTITLPNQGAP